MAAARIVKADGLKYRIVECGAIDIDGQPDPCFGVVAIVGTWSECFQHFLVHGLADLAGE